MKKGLCHPLVTQPFFMHQTFSLMTDLASYNVLSLWAFLSLSDSELNRLAFAQSLESAALDCAVMYEYVWAIFLLNEAEAF